MGVCLYDPALGRFLQVDPVEGGSANDYDYANADAVNNYDLDGKQCVTGVARRVTKHSRGPSGRRYTYTKEICRSLARGLRRVQRHIDTSAGVCIIACVSFGQQGGRLYVQRGIGPALSAGATIEWSNRRMRNRGCSSVTAGGFGASGQTSGAKGDVALGVSPGIGGGVAYLWSYDGKYCKQT